MSFGQINKIAINHQVIKIQACDRIATFIRATLSIRKALLNTIPPLPLSIPRLTSGSSQAGLF